jgi:hypothetical protein
MKWFCKVSLAKSEKREAKVTILIYNHTFAIGLILSLGNPQNSEMIFYEVEILKTIMIIVGWNLGNFNPPMTLSIMLIKKSKIFKFISDFFIKTYSLCWCGNWP